MLTVQNQLRAEIIRAAVPRVIARPFGDDFTITSTPSAEELRESVVAIFTDGKELDRVNAADDARAFEVDFFFPTIRKMEREGYIRETQPSLGVSHYVLTRKGRAIASRLGYTQ